MRQRVFQVVNGAIVAAAGRRLRISHVVEHPKSGGSWVRNMIQRYLGGRAYFSDRLIRPNTVIQSVRLYRSLYCNPIALFRDPRDIFVSYYYHELRGAEGIKTHGFEHDPEAARRDDFAHYLRCKLERPTHPRFRFVEFVDSWHDRPGVCNVRYEDFLSDAAGTLRKVVEFLGHTPDEARIAEVVDYHSFAKASARRGGKARRPGEENKKQFERKGIHGDWRNHFNQASCELMQRYEWTSLQRLGYEDDREWVTRFLDELDTSAD